jgi:hypothetical protein
MTQDGSAFTDWFLADSWQDYRQQRAIRELDSQVYALNSSLSRQSTESRHLRSQLAQLQGSMEDRLRALTRAFDAFVELSDIRATLSMFDPPALVRHRVRQLIVALADSPGLVDGADFADVPGYWLAAAAPALLTVLRGADPGATVDTALSRDPDRTALLLTLGTAVAGRADLGAPWLARAFPPLSTDRPVTRAQRMLWTEAVAGRFGEPGADLVRQRLTDLAGSLTPAQDQAMARATANRITAGPAPSARGVSSDGGMHADAAARLTALRTLCTTAAVAPAAAVAGTSTVESVLRELVDEGSDEEIALLRRAAELRAVIENRDSTTVEPWDAPAGPPTDLLLADAFGPDSALARLGRQVGTRWLLAAARQFAAEATGTPPEETTVDIAGVRVRVRTDGPDTGDLAQARAAIARRYPQEAGGQRLTWTLAAAGAALFVPVAFLPTALAVLAGLAGAGLLIGAATRWWRRRQANAQRATQQAGELAHTDRQAEAAGKNLSALRDRTSAQASQAAADLAAIESALAP